MDCYNRFAESIKNGDEKSFEVFFKMEFNNIVHFINAYINDFSAAQDLAQDVFISFWHKRSYINSNLNIRSYIFKIARNKTLNYIRDNRAAAAKISLTDFYALQDEIVTERIDALKLEELINRTYNKLPSEIRDTFYLNRIHGFTYAEIAEQRQVSVKAIEYQIKKALQVFRKRLKNHLATFFTVILFILLKNL